MEEKLGVYKNIQYSGEKTKDNHKLYYATCSVCGKTVKRRYADIRRYSDRCTHTQGNKNTYKFPKINDLKGFCTQDETSYRIYSMWKNMLDRSRPEYWDKKECYRGTTVCKEWYTLSNFVRDIKELPNYDEQAKNEEVYFLDKDVLGNGQKHYSKETCCFLTHADSNRDVINRHPENIEKFQKGNKEYTDSYAKPIKAIHSKTCEIKYFESIHECARQLNVEQSNVWCCLSNDPKYKSNKRVKKYYLEFITQEEYKNNN